jgi:hypothetical protein
MFEFEGVSQPSQLERQDATDARVVHGYRCWNCGEWRDVEVVPVRPMPPADTVKPPYVAPFKSQAYLVVERFFDSIAGLRRDGSSWYTVARLMAQAGYKCQEKTLQKYFLMEQHRRNDGQAQAT